MSHATHHPEDTGAAFSGLIAGAIFLGAMMYGIVLLTNRHFEQKKAAEAATPPAAEAPATH